MPGDAQWGNGQCWLFLFRSSAQGTADTVFLLWGTAPPRAVGHAKGEWPLSAIPHKEHSVPAVPQALGEQLTLAIPPPVV